MKFSSTLYNFCILSDSLEPFPLKPSKTVSPRMLPHVDIHYLDLIALKCVIRRFGSLIKLHRHNKRVVFKLVLINARRCNKAGFSWTQYNLITSIICSALHTKTFLQKQGNMIEMLVSNQCAEKEMYRMPLLQIRKLNQYTKRQLKPLLIVTRLIKRKIIKTGNWVSHETQSSHCLLKFCILWKHK